MAAHETFADTDRGFVTAAEAEKRQHEAVAEALDLLGYAAAREDELDAALLRCIDAIEALAGIPLAGPADELAPWRDRLDAAWEARAHAMDVRTRMPGRASKPGVA